MAKITIGLPSGEMVYTDFALSLAYLCTYTTMQGHQIALASVRSSVLADSRNHCVDVALKTNSDHLLFIDSDLIFPHDACVRLLDHCHNKRHKIVGATYSKRYPNDKELATQVPDRFFSDKKEDDLIHTDVLPCGMLMIDTGVFRKMKSPHFTFEWNEKRGKHDGEDVRFCREARRRGYDIMLDTTLSFELAHIGVVPHRINPTHAYSSAK